MEARFSPKEQFPGMGPDDPGCHDFAAGIQGTLRLALNLCSTGPSPAMRSMEGWSGAAAGSGLNPFLPQPFLKISPKKPQRQ